MDKTCEKPTWDDIRPMIEAAKGSDEIKETFGRALDKWMTDVWNDKRAKAEDFPAYFLAEHQPQFLATAREQR